MKSMKKFLRNFLAITICACMSFSIMACKDKGQDSSSSNGTENEQQLTGYKVVNRSVSEYKIVIPDDATANISFASSELNYFLREATGAEISVIQESEYKGKEPVISLGSTDLATENNVRTSEELGISGYYMKVVNESLFILGGSNPDSAGVLYGVYDFLYDTIGFKVYAADEIYYEQKSSIELYNYDKTYKPTFDERECSYRTLVNDVTYQQRMRVSLHSTNSRWGGVLGHNQARYILSASEYMGAHPEWYNADGSQLCWTAHGDAVKFEEMAQEFAKRSLTYIEGAPTATYFLFGQEDNNLFCVCDGCTQAKNEYAMNAQGLQIVFVNRVIEIIEEYLKENGIERDLRYLIYAYMGTLTPPVDKWEDGTLVPYSDKIIPHDKLYIWVTPIGLDYTKPIEHINNIATAEALEGWKVLADGRLMVYSYSTNFRNFFVNWNNIDTLKSHYQSFAGSGTAYMYSQGPGVVTPTFEEMRVYIETQLMWNVDQDVETLVKDFMQHYYKDAADAMYTYYSLIRNRYATYQVTVGGSLGGIYSSIGTADIWTESLVSAMGDCLEDAFEAIEVYKDTDTELYARMQERIMRQKISVTFLKLSHYQAYYSEEEVKQMISEFNHYTKLYNMTAHLEGGSVEGLFGN